MHGQQITPAASVESGAGPCCEGGGHPGRAGGKTEEDPREAGVQDAGVGTRLGHIWILLGRPFCGLNVLIKDPGSVSLSW